MEVQIAAAKVNKYAISESGDTLEVVERPNGGLSVVLADGQTSGRGAKAVSQLVVRKVIGLLAEGVRDGAAARAASDASTQRNKVRSPAPLTLHRWIYTAEPVFWRAIIHHPCAFVAEIKSTAATKKASPLAYHVTSARSSPKYQSSQA